MAAETSQTLDRGLTVLELLADSSDGMTVTEIAVTLEVSRTVVYRLVVTLEQHALLRRGIDGRCRLGMAVLALARQVQPVLRDAAVPALRRLADTVGATAHLTVVDGVRRRGGGGRRAEPVRLPRRLPGRLAVRARARGGGALGAGGPGQQRAPVRARLDRLRPASCSPARTGSRRPCSRSPASRPRSASSPSASSSSRRSARRCCAPPVRSPGPCAERSATESRRQGRANRAENWAPILINEMSGVSRAAGDRRGDGVDGPPGRQRAVPAAPAGRSP